MSLGQKLGIGIFGLGLLASGCDNYKVKLAEREYNGKVKIELTQEVITLGDDAYTLEVKDSTGTVIARIKAYRPHSQTYLYLGTGEKYTLKYKGVKKE